MKPRGILLAATPLLAVVVVLIAMSGPRDCPAIGYVNVSDIELRFSAEPANVAACFGGGCAPASVTKSSEGKWLVPQRPPYLPLDPTAGPGPGPGDVKDVKVAATDAAGRTTEYVVGIGRERADGIGFAQCPGPSKFRPVQVP